MTIHQLLNMIKKLTVKCNDFYQDDEGFSFVKETKAGFFKVDIMMNRGEYVFASVDCWSTKETKILFSLVWDLNSCDKGVEIFC